MNTDLINQGEPDPSPSFADRIPAQAAVLYGEPSTLHRDALRGLEQAHGEALSTTDETRAAIAEATEILGKYTQTASAGKSMADAFASVARSKPSAEQIAGWRAQSMQHLRDTYGPRAGDVLAATARMVKADPALARKLAGGLGNHPSIVATLAQKASRA